MYIQLEKIKFDYELGIWYIGTYTYVREPIHFHL